MMLRIDIHRWFAMAAILIPKWPPKYKIPPNGAKGVGMIRTEIGLKNRQIINETYSFRCFLIL
jgi:hypothetical protein